MDALHRNQNFEASICLDNFRKGEEHTFCYYFYDIPHGIYFLIKRICLYKALKVSHCLARITIIVFDILSFRQRWWSLQICF